tara:strand:+ start:10395 stop:12329 length:1935 start_codon:yes stop_codon:yes gene_type:complete
MAVIGSLVVNVLGNTSGLNAAMARSRAILTKFKGAAGAAGAGMTAMGAAAVVLTKNFEGVERAMNKSLAIMGNIAPMMRKDMTNAAIEVARTTNFSTQQAAESYFFLASAGMSAKESLDALPVVARFAQAGAFDMATATDLSTDALSAMGLKSKDAATNLQNLTRVSDVLIKANTLANATAQQFSEALTTKAAAALRLVNKEMEEGVAVLAVFADQGIKGAEAGTALNIVMRDLATKAIRNKEAFAQAGVTVFDSSGKMRNMADIVGDLERSLGGMSDRAKKAALLQMGFTDKSIAFTSALIGTSDEIRRYQSELDTAGGITKEVSDNQMTELQHAIAELTAAWAKMGTEAGGVASVLASVVMDLAKLIEWVGKGGKSVRSFADILHGFRLAWHGLLLVFKMVALFIATVLFEALDKIVRMAKLLSFGLLKTTDKFDQDMNAFREKIQNKGTSALKGFNDVLMEQTPHEKYRRQLELDQAANNKAAQDAEDRAKKEKEELEKKTKAARAAAARGAIAPITGGARALGGFLGGMAKRRDKVHGAALLASMRLRAKMATPAEEIKPQADRNRVNKALEAGSMEAFKAASGQKAPEREKAIRDTAKNTKRQVELQEKTLETFVDLSRGAGSLIGNLSGRAFKGLGGG